MAVKRSRRRAPNWRAADLLKALMADRGWHAIDIERASAQTGHPLRTVSYKTVYRVTSDGFVPTHPYQFEIAAAFGLLPSQIWGAAPLPAQYAYLNSAVAA